MIVTESQFNLTSQFLEEHFSKYRILKDNIDMFLKFWKTGGDDVIKAFVNAIRHVYFFKLSEPYDSLVQEIGKCVTPDKVLDLYCKLFK